MLAMAKLLISKQPTTVSPSKHYNFTYSPEQKSPFISNQQIMAFWVVANDRFILTAFLYNKMINFNTVFYCMAVYQTTPTLSNIVLSILALLTNILLVYRTLHVSKLLSVKFQAHLP